MVGFYRNMQRLGRNVVGLNRNMQRLGRNMNLLCRNTIVNRLCSHEVWFLKA